MFNGGARFYFTRCGKSEIGKKRGLGKLSDGDISCLFAFSYESPCATHPFLRFTEKEAAKEKNRTFKEVTNATRRNRAALFLNKQSMNGDHFFHRSPLYCTLKIPSFLLSTEVFFGTEVLSDIFISSYLFS